MAERRERRVLLVAAFAAAGMALATVPAGAQLPLLPPGPTTTTTAPGGGGTTTTTTTTTAPPLLAPPSRPAPAERPTPTTSPPQPSPSPTPTGAPSSTVPPRPSDAPSEGDGVAPPSAVAPFPASLQRFVDSVRRSQPSDTRGLLAALEPLAGVGLDTTQRAKVGMGRFPIAGEASWTHDWWVPRFGPGWRLHQGTDIFAAEGTPVVAPVDGHVRISNGGLGGLAVDVVEPSGTYWYLAHLAALPDGLRDGDPVTTGDIVGFVGATGNAQGGAAHVHLQIHPGGRAPIDPKSVLDRFVADALARVPEVLAAHGVGGTAPVAETVEPEATTAIVLDDRQVVAILLGPMTPSPLRWVLSR